MFYILFLAILIIVVLILPPYVYKKITFRINEKYFYDDLVKVRLSSNATQLAIAQNIADDLQLINGTLLANPAQLTSDINKWIVKYKQGRNDALMLGAIDETNIVWAYNSLMENYVVALKTNPKVALEINNALSLWLTELNVVGNLLKEEYL